MYIRSYSRKMMIGLVLLAVCLLSLTTFTNRAEAADPGPVITNYHVPCQGDTAGSVSTFHGVNRDGKPPLDRSRKAYDFNCDVHSAYSPTAGRVYVQTLRFAGLIMIDDAANGVCLVVLHMKSIAVRNNQTITAGTYLGTFSGVNLHMAAVNGKCEAGGLYDIEARTRERFIKWIEIGKILDVDIPVPKAIALESKNPGVAVDTAGVNPAKVGANVPADFPPAQTGRYGCAL
jgi:hypothetical protein